MAHKGTKDFLLGALIGGAIGFAAVSASRSKKGASMRKFRQTIAHVGKALNTPKNEKNLAEIIDWATEGVQLWNKLKKGN